MITLSPKFPRCSHYDLKILAIFYYNNAYGHVTEHRRRPAAVRIEWRKRWVPVSSCLSSFLNQVKMMLSDLLACISRTRIESKEASRVPWPSQGRCVRGDNEHFECSQALIVQQPPATHLYYSDACHLYSVSYDNQFLPWHHIQMNGLLILFHTRCLGQS